MFLCKGNVIVYDPDLEMLAEVLEVIDRQLATVFDGWDDAEEAVQLGYLDRSEHITGFGFVACQTYLTATYGFLDVAEYKWLDVGPVHRTGLRIVKIVNDAANFWKHHAAWHLDKSPKSPERQKRIRDTFGALGVPDDSDYPLSSILTGLTVPDAAAFKSLVAKLAAWRDELRSGCQLPLIGG